MKSLLIIFLLVSQFILAQDEIENVFLDVIDYRLYPNTCSQIGYLTKVPKGMLDYHLDIIRKNPSLTYYRIEGKQIKDSITLNAKEKAYILSEFEASKGYVWEFQENNEQKEVEETRMLEFLKDDPNRELKVVSKPVFIRNKSLVCLLSTHLCCGEINGYSSISIYRKLDGKWEQWIPLTEGAF